MNRPDQDHVRPSGLAAHLVKRLGALDLDIDLRCRPGEVVALLGPNGSGKTTTLRCLCGLTPIDDGSIRLDDVMLDDAANGVFVSAQRRPVGVVFQDYVLFPHLSARENVAFGLRARGTRRAEARRAADEWLARVGLADLASHRPRSLSGGQQQRVALARALATEPRLLLLDEPLSALDASTRAELRRELRRHLDTFAGVTILVTHDPIDAHAVADRVVVIESGRITQTGTMAELRAQPRSRYVAQLVGVNLLRGTARDGHLALTDGFALTIAEPVAGDAYAVIPPSAVALFRARPDGSPRNVWETAIVAIDHHHDRVRIELGAPVPLAVEVTAPGLAALGARPGDRVWASVKATEIAVYPA